MKRLAILLLLAGCAHTPPVAAPAPSVAGVKSGIVQAQASIDKAQAQLEQARGASEQIGKHITAARSKADRIDGKATVILENWQ